MLTLCSSSAPTSTVRKAHNTGRNHLQNVRDYYASLDAAQNDAIFAKVLKHYEDFGLPPPSLPAPSGGGRGGGGGLAGYAPPRTFTLNRPVTRSLQFAVLCS